MYEHSPYPEAHWLGLMFLGQLITTLEETSLPPWRWSASARKRAPNVFSAGTFERFFFFLRCILIVKENYKK